MKELERELDVVRQRDHSTSASDDWCRSRALLSRQCMAARCHVMRETINARRGPLLPIQMGCEGFVGAGKTSGRHHEAHRVSAR